MVMSSHQISAMAMQQQAMFGNVANYAQQITPLGGMSPGMGGMPYTGGYSMGPGGGMSPYGGGMSPYGGLPQMAMGAMYGAPGSGMQQGFAEQALGTGLSGLSGLAGGISGLAGGIAGLAGTASMAAGGIGAIGGMMSGAGAMAGWGAGTAALGAVPYLGGAVAAAGGIPFALGAGALAVGAGMANEVYGGFQQRQGVNRMLRQNFGGMMGVGGGRGGMGFNPQEMGGISTMMREMSGNDMFTQFDELTRVMDRTSTMGLYRGVQSAREFREKFRKTVDTLKEIASTMHTSLEGATQFMEQQRNQGFFSGQDISASLLNTRLQAGATGMTTQQMTQVGTMGAQQGRAMGMLGRSGALAAQNMAGNVSLAMRMGIVSDEMISEATGGLMGAEGAQAYSGRMMGVTNRFLSRGAGRAMLAGMWDPETGGINEEMLRSAAGGGLSFREALRSGRRNIAQTGGRRSEFFAQEERIRGRLLSSGMGPEAVMGMLGQHMERERGLSLDDPIMQRWVRRRLGVSQSEVELMSKMTQSLPAILQEQRARFGQQLEQESVTRAREGSGIEGFRRRISQVWERDVLNPFRQVGDDLTTAFSDAVQGAVDELEGRVSTRMTTVGKRMAMDLARTGKSSLQFRSDVGLSQGDLSGRLGSFQRPGGGGALAGIGRALGMRGGNVTAELAGMGYRATGDHARDMATRDRLREAGQVDWDALGMSASDTSSMGRELSNLIIDNPNAGGRFAPGALEEILGVGPGFYQVGGGRAETQQATLSGMLDRRTNMLLQKHAGLRERTKGMSRLQKREFVSKLLASDGRLSGTSFDIEKYSVSGSGFRLGESLGALKSMRASAISQLQGDIVEDRTGAAATAADALATVGGGMAGQLFGIPGMIGGALLGRRANKALVSRSVGGDLAGLLDAAREDPALYASIQGLAGQGDVSREDAIRNLTMAGEGVELGSDLSKAQQVAARNLAARAQKDAKGTEELLDQVLFADSEKARQLMLRPLHENANKMKDYVRANRDTFDEQLSAGGRKSLDEYLAIQSDKSKTYAEINEARRKLLEELGGTKDGQVAAALIGRDVSGRYLAGELERAGSIFGRIKGMRRERDKIKLVVGSLLGEQGSKLLTSDRLRALEQGKLSVEKFMDELREQGGGTISLEELGGRTEAEFSQELGRRFGIAKRGVSEGEAKEFAAGRAAEEGRRLQLEGQRDEERDLPSLAKKQIQHLSNMQKLLTAIAQKKTIVNVNVDEGGDVQIESPSGKKKT